MGLGTIHSINGRTLRVSQGREGLFEYVVAMNAEVLLDGTKVSLADLTNGDEVTVSNSDRDGFHRVHATRSPKERTVLSAGNSIPRPVRINEETGQVEPVDASVKSKK